MPRDCHAACCLNFGDDHPQLLVTGGQDMNNKVLDDAWILDVRARTWRKVNLCYKSIHRHVLHEPISTEQIHCERTHMMTLYVPGYVVQDIIISLSKLKI